MRKQYMRAGRHIESNEELHHFAVKWQTIKRESLLTNQLRCGNLSKKNQNKAKKRNSKYPGSYREKAVGVSLCGLDAEPVLEL